jgi:hypothetical protein
MMLRHACVRGVDVNLSLVDVVGCCCCRSLVDVDFFEGFELCGVSAFSGFVFPAIDMGRDSDNENFSRDLLCPCGIG